MLTLSSDQLHKIDIDKAHRLTFILDLAIYYKTLNVDHWGPHRLPYFNRIS